MGLDPPRDWIDLQEKVAALFSKVPGCRALLNHNVSGARICNVAVDVYAEFGAESTDPFIMNDTGFIFTVIVECKHWKTRVPQEKVFALKTIVEDVGADRGLLITEAGVQKGAEKYLQSPCNIQALTFAELKVQLQPRYRIKCSKCGSEGLNLPFRPNFDKVHLILCRKCHRDKVQSFTN